jgi:hypothetical protein
MYFFAKLPKDIKMGENWPNLVALAAALVSSREKQVCIIFFFRVVFFRPVQGCQMVCFHTKNTISAKFKI